MSAGRYDLIVVGAGIVGLAHALAGSARGWRVAVVEQDARCVGASVRNFGFVTVTGQRAGSTWRRALRSRQVWAEVAPRAGIGIVQQGLWLLARRPEAAEVLHAFAGGEMGQGCTLHGPAEVARLAPGLRTDGLALALHSPHELRVESHSAIGQLAAWLAEVRGVQFHFGEAALQVQGEALVTSRRRLAAPRIVLCPGAQLTGLAAPWLPPLHLSRLQMLRVIPRPGLALPAPVMGDLSLVRYAGYAGLPQAQALRERLQHECADSLAHGIHLIVVQSADGSLVVGDSHHEAEVAEPFASELVDTLILRHLRELVALDDCTVLQRWSGAYPVGHPQDALVLAPEPGLRVVVVTSGTGASTAFALAEEVTDEWS